MTNLLSRAAWARVIPFALFMALLALRGLLTPSSPDAAPGAFDGRWVYGIGVVVVTASLIVLRRQYTELLAGSRLRWHHALHALGVIAEPPLGIDETRRGRVPLLDDVPALRVQNGAPGLELVDHRLEATECGAVDDGHPVPDDGPLELVL